MKFFAAVSPQFPRVNIRGSLSRYVRQRNADLLARWDMNQAEYSNRGGYVSVGTEAFAL